ncbi:MAG: hypothetical protein WHT27_07180 [candidate division WOR-3 bacterium]
MKKFFVIFILLVSLTLFSDPKEESLKILNSFKSILDTTTTYTCILHEYVKSNNKSTDNYWDYKFLKPKYIRMESIKGDRLGSKAFFDCKTQKVTGRQGGILSKIKLTLDLSNSLVKNIRGITIAESDWPYVLNRTFDILDDNGVEIFTGEAKFKGVKTNFIHIKNINLEKYRFDETKMFFDENNLLIGFYNFEKGDVVEDIHYQNIKINPPLTMDSMYVK